MSKTGVFFDVSLTPMVLLNFIQKTGSLAGIDLIALKPTAIIEYGPLNRILLVKYIDIY